MAKTTTIHNWAACLRIFIFLMNGFVWLGALLAIVCGLMVGFSNGTFSLDAEEDDEYEGGEIRWKDALYTTPATLLIYYGVLMLLAAISGCFAGAGGRRCCNLTFVVMILITLLFDIIFGYLVFWNPFAMRNFISNLDKSMNSYGINKRATFGVIPQNVTNYWDHLQRTGSCCGKFGSGEWENKTIGSEEYAFSIPDSCCINDYDYKQCGWRIWKHMEDDMNHYRSQMLKKMGCVSIFPEEITTKYHEIAYVVIMLGIFMVVCGFCAIILLILTCSNKYKAGQGPQAKPHFARLTATPPEDTTYDEEDPKDHDANGRQPPVSDDVEGVTVEGVRRRTSSDGVFSRNRVYPIKGDESEAEVDMRSANEKSFPVNPRRRTLETEEYPKDPYESAHYIYMNKEYDTHSEVEELPVVYRTEAETRLKNDELMHAQGGNRPLSQ